MPNDPYTDDEYDDTYEKVHGDEPARDQYAGQEATDDTFFPSGVGNSLYPSGWGIWPAGDTVDATTEEGDETADATGTDPATTERNESDSDSSWLSEGLIGTFLLVGVILFLFPEPATSAVGIAMVAMGVVAWVAEWAMS